MDGPSTAIQEIDTSPLVDLKRRLDEADGELIRLNKRFSSGEQLALSVRLGQRPSQEVVDHNKRNYGNDLAEDTYLVDAYSIGEDGVPNPVGHWDWVVRKKDGKRIANGGLSHRHEAETYPAEPWHFAADKKWGGQFGIGLAFKVDEGYRGQGIGSLLFASSVVAIEGSADILQTGLLREPAQNVLRKFGIEGDRYYEAPIQEFASNPKIDEVLQAAL